MQNILLNTFFAIFSAVLGAVFGLILSKPTNRIRSNESKIIHIREYIIQQEVVYKSNEKKSETNRSTNNSNSNNDNETLFFILIFSFLLASLYNKYHIEIINSFIILSIIIITSATIFGYVLCKRDSLDELSKYWIIVTVVLTLFNIISIIFMANQDVSITNGLYDYARLIYYICGAVIITLANLILVAAYIHIISFNTFIRFPNKFTYNVMKKFDKIFCNRKKITIAIAILVLISLLYSSGLFYEFVQLLIAS